MIGPEEDNWDFPETDEDMGAEYERTISAIAAVTQTDPGLEAAVGLEWRLFPDGSETGAAEEFFYRVGAGEVALRDAEATLRDAPQQGL